MYASRRVVHTRMSYLVADTYIAMCAVANHRSSPGSMTRSPSPGPRLPARARMPVGTTGLYRPASLTTRRRPTGALEDCCIHCTFSWMTSSYICHNILRVYCVQSHMPIGVLPYTTRQPPSVGMTSQCPPVYICIIVYRRTPSPDGQQLNHRQPPSNSVHRVDAGEAG